MLESHKNLNSQLISEGTIIIPKEDIPLTENDWETLCTTLDHLEYEDIYQGDLDEATSVKVFRIKKENDPTTYHPQLVAIINSPSMRKYLSSILEIDDCIIDRYQCHVYHEGDFVGKHQDNKSCSDYEYAFIIHLDGQYEGGEFCVYNTYESTPSHTYRPPRYSLMITKCSLPHEVKKVTKGERKVIAGFLKSDTPSTH